LPVPGPAHLKGKVFLKYVVVYDVVEDRTRDKVADCLEDFGDRVQKSVFEVDVDADRYGRMVELLLKLIDPETDSVRIYPICSTCLGKLRILGQGVVISHPDVVIV